MQKSENAHTYLFGNNTLELSFLLKLLGEIKYSNRSVKKQTIITKQDKYIL